MAPEGFAIVTGKQVNKTPADNLDLITFRKRAGVEANGKAILAYEVAAELGVHPTAVSMFENGRRESLPGGGGRAAYEAAVTRIVARRRSGVAA